MRLGSISKLPGIRCRSQINYRALVSHRQHIQQRPWHGPQYIIEFPDAGCSICWPRRRTPRHLRLMQVYPGRKENDNTSEVVPGTKSRHITGACVHDASAQTETPILQMHRRARLCLAFVIWARARRILHIQRAGPNEACAPTCKCGTVVSCATSPHLERGSIADHPPSATHIGSTTTRKSLLSLTPTFRSHNSVRRADKRLAHLS